MSWWSIKPWGNVPMCGCGVPIYDCEEKPMNRDDIGKLVDRFLSWPLPDSVRADDCATIQGYPHRIGTNLLTADEARQMLEYVLAARGQGKGTKMTERTDTRDAGMPDTFDRILNRSSRCMVEDGSGKLHSAVKAKISDIEELRTAHAALREENERLQADLDAAMEAVRDECARVATRFTCPNSCCCSDCERVRRVIREIKAIDLAAIISRARQQSDTSEAAMAIARRAISSIGSFDKQLQDYYQKQLDKLSKARRT